MSKPIWLHTRLQGTGSGIFGAALTDAPTSSGRVLSVDLHQEVGGGATETDLLLVHRLHELVTIPPPSRPRPGLMHIIIEGITAADGFTPSLSESYTQDFSDMLRHFSGGLAVLLNITATGVWSVNFDVEVLA